MFEDISPISQTKMVTPEHFYCLLDEQPHYFIPERYPESENDNNLCDKLIVNPHCWFSWNGSPPKEVLNDELIPSHFAKGTEMVWIHDPEIHYLSPFWLGQEYTALLFGIKPGESISIKLSAQIRSVLSFARVLVSDDNVAKWHSEWNSAISYCAERFKRGYVPLGRLIHPYHIAALRRYYRCLIRKGEFKLGDTQSPRRYVVHNETVAKFFHHQLGFIVSKIVGKAVKPSYVYLASYQSEAELPKHIDREQCEYSITLCIDYSPEPKCESSWPLYLDTDDKTVAVLQGIGDSLLFKGRELTHYRKKLPKGFTSTSLFFHFVNADFNGSLQ